MDATDAPGIADEGSMDKVFNINSARKSPWMIARTLRDPLESRGNDRHADVAAPTVEQPAYGTRLPPTRAARTLRSRGVFLAAGEPSWSGRVRRLANASIAALAIAVVAVSSALIMGAPAKVMGVALYLNPGPGIVGAASVPPSFVEPSRTR